MIPIGVDRGQRRAPWMTIALALVNTLVYIWTASQPNFEQIKIGWGFVPGYACLDTLLSHMFLHDNPLHLIGNLIFFLVPAMKLEDAVGGPRMLWLYIGSGVAANGCHVLMAGETPVPLIGASGAIAGVVGAFMVLYPTSRMLFWILPPLPITIYLPSWFFLGFWFLRELGTGWLVQTEQILSSVAVWAHVGGFLFGALSMALFFGWNKGWDLERQRQGWLKAVAALFSSAAPFSRPLVRRGRSRMRSAGWALQSAAAAYAATVYISGGFVNPDRPTNQIALAAAIVKDPRQRQAVRSQFREAASHGADTSLFGQWSGRVLLGRIQSEINDVAKDHRALRKGRLAAPRGEIASVDRFLHEEYPRLPKTLQIPVEDGEPLSALYAPGESYEIVYGSKLPPSMAYCAFLGELNERGWSEDRLFFHMEAQTGEIEARAGDWTLTLLVAPSDGASLYPTALVCRAEGDGPINASSHRRPGRPLLREGRLPADRP
ncbi:MAG: rhomboid family intramembrane serine protease [Candidatus Sumerlaeota bacterium]|nr:rhomboid family intramembrane serine protease [Candidatus Sumerlaeota bacterium]